MLYTWNKCQLFLSFKYTLTYGHTGKQSEDPKGGEQKADHVQMLRLKEGYADEFPGFSFLLYMHQTSSWGNQQHRNTNGHRVKKAPKSLLSLTKEPGKRQLNKTEKFQWLSHVLLFSLQAPLSMDFSRQECWNGSSLPSPGDVPNAGIKPRPPALQADSLPSEPPGRQKTFRQLTCYLSKTPHKNWGPTHASKDWEGSLGFYPPRSHTPHPSHPHPPHPAPPTPIRLYQRTLKYPQNGVKDSAVGMQNFHLHWGNEVSQWVQWEAIWEPGFPPEPDTHKRFLSLSTAVRCQALERLKTLSATQQWGGQSCHHGVSGGHVRSSSEVFMLLSAREASVEA